MTIQIEDEQKYLLGIQEQLEEYKTDMLAAKKNVDNTTENLEHLTNEAENVGEALKIAQEIAQQIQEQAHSRIAGVVTNCLQTVFNKPYKFKIIFAQKRNRTEAELVFEKNGMDVDPLTASGGGVVDVAAFALRLSCIVLHKPTLRRVVLLDEPFKFVSAQYRENVRTMLESLAKDFNVQFIMVTHISELVTGKVITI